MPETFLTLARGVFDQKFRELKKFHDQLKSGRIQKTPLGLKKFREFKQLVAELGKNYRKSEKLLAEIQILLKK